MITENLSTLKIHKLTQAQYDRELEAGNIDENALYLTPDEEDKLLYSECGFTKNELKILQTGYIDEFTIKNNDSHNYKTFDFHGATVGKLVVLGEHVRIKNAIIKSTTQIGGTYINENGEEINYRTCNNFFIDVTFEPRDENLNCTPAIVFAERTWATVFTRCGFRGRHGYYYTKNDTQEKVFGYSATPPNGYTLDSGTHPSPIECMAVHGIKDSSRGTTISFNQCHFYAFQSICTTVGTGFAGVMNGGYIDACDYVIKSDAGGTIDFEMTAVDAEIMKSIFYGAEKLATGAYPYVIANITYNASYGQFLEGMINFRNGMCNCYVGGASFVAGNTGLVFNSDCPINTCYTNVPNQLCVSAPLSSAPSLYRLRYSVAPGETYVPLDNITITIGYVIDKTLEKNQGKRNQTTSNIQIIANKEGVDVSYMNSPPLTSTDISDSVNCYNLRDVKPAYNETTSLGKGKIIIKNNTEKNQWVLMDIPSYCRLAPNGYVLPVDVPDLYEYVNGEVKSLDELNQ